MTKSMKEVIKICTEPKMAEFLGKYSKDWHYRDFYWDKEKMDFETRPELWENCFWLPISFDTERGMLQIEWLLLKKLGIKSLRDLDNKKLGWELEKVIARGAEGQKELMCHSEKSYVVQCLYWLKELINKEA